MRTLLIDNYDSFTYNLFHLLEAVNGRPPTTLRNDDVAALEALDLADIDAIVVSPGPGRPDNSRDFGISNWALTQSELPVLGVCLGHQGMCLIAGATIARAPEPVHGRVSDIYHEGAGLFAGLPSPFKAVRYHSLVAYDLPPEIEPLARTEDGLLMAARRLDRPAWGVQFHPESIASEFGERLLANFRDLALATARGRSRAVQPHKPSPRRRPAEALMASPYRLHVRELASLPDAEAAFATLFGDDPIGFWLDSSRVIAGLSRFSMLGGGGPLAEHVDYSVSLGEVTVRRPDGVELARLKTDVFTYLDQRLTERRLPDAGLPCDFNLGYVGYLGYELKADCGAEAAHQAPQPDASLLFCDRGLLIDHSADRAWLLSLSRRDDPEPAERWLDHAVELLRDATAPAPPDRFGHPVAVSARHTEEEYLDLIARCHEEIRAGESYEVCLTNMLSVPVSVDPFATYQALRRRNPAPYSAFLRYPDFAVLSSSPERFLRIDRHGNAESKPIKGTRRRGDTAEHDERLRAELIGSEKDRAENLMIIDLVRNDLGRVCEAGSVHVPALFSVETYQTVHQLVSTVCGRLRPDVSAVRCVQANFPGGSMTGAPKLRTLEILDRLEGGSRGIYSGAVGYFSLNGGADFNIVIRTMVVTPAEVTIGVGGAITILSDPAEEVAETQVKAGALLEALSWAAHDSGMALAHAAGQR